MTMMASAEASLQKEDAGREPACSAGILAAQILRLFRDTAIAQEQDFYDFNMRSAAPPAITMSRRYIAVTARYH